MKKTKTKLINKWTILAGLLLGSLLCVLAVASFFLLRSKDAFPSMPTADLVVIPLPENTPTPDPSFIPTPEPTEIQIGNGDIGLGAFVQVFNTSGSGLQIRSGAGVQNPPNFVALDAEVFEVVDGPVEADGYTWWLLTAPYDETRSGWAASAYLEVIAQ